MSGGAIKNHAGFIWSVADLLRGVYKQSEYGPVILCCHPSGFTSANEASSAGSCAGCAACITPATSDPGRVPSPPRLDVGQRTGVRRACVDANAARRKSPRAVHRG